MNAEKKVSTAKKIFWQKVRRHWDLIRSASEIIFTLWITDAAFKWISHIAYMQRGYKTIGGEILFTVFAAYAAYKLADAVFQTLEVKIYASSKKRRCRRSSARKY